MAAPPPGRERGPAAPPPHHAGRPYRPVGIEGKLARLRLVGDEPAVRIDHRHAVRVEQGVALADLDILITDAAEQRDGRADRHGHVGARIFALQALVELARLLPLIAARDLPAERPLARTTAHARPGHRVVWNSVPVGKRVTGPV